MNVGGNIRDGISGMSSSVMAKPKELAAHLLKHRSGSFDNLTESTSLDNVDKVKRSHQVILTVRSFSQNLTTPNRYCLI